MRGLLGYIRRNHVGLVALVLALTGTAYAATQFTGKDIKNKSITAKDVKPNALGGKQFKDGGLSGTDIHDGSISGADVTDGSLSGSDVSDGSISGADVADDSLTGADIDESTLNVTRVVARLRDSTDRAVPRGTATPTLLGEVGPWTQQADEIDQFSGQFTVDFPAGCKGTYRTVTIYAHRPGTGPVGAGAFPGLVGSGSVSTGTAGAVTASGTIEGLGFLVGMSTSDPDEFEPGAAVSRKLSISATSTCDSNSTADPVVTDVKLDVLGFR